MKQISIKIQETEQAIREAFDSIQEIHANIGKLNAELQSALEHNNALAARLKTLKEIEAAGADVFAEQVSE